MTPDTQETVVRRLFEYADGPCGICFQGGEPTLAGLAFFRAFVQNIRRFNRRSLPVSYSLQTNGLLIDAAWAAFFAENRFLIGLSLDGTEAAHDRYRTGADGAGTFARVMEAARLLALHRVEFNLLTVLTAYAAEHIEEIYRFFLQSGFPYQQYIPCLDPLGQGRGGQAFSLTPEAYAGCLIRLFDAWHRDRTDGTFVYIRDFENLAGMLLGYPPERCGMSGRCVNQFVIESDADVYPCDFYTLDPYCIGNLTRDGFPALERGCDGCGFVRESIPVHPACAACEWYPLCRGGCRRDRQGVLLHDVGLNYYCESYKAFYRHAVPKMRRLIRQLSGEAPEAAACGD